VIPIEGKIVEKWMEVKKYMCDGEIEYKNTGNPRCKVPKLKK